MARVEFQSRLDMLEASLQEQGDVVLRSVRGAMDALARRDIELCDEVIRFDDEIDARYHRLEKSVEEVLAQQSQPQIAREHPGAVPESGGIEG